MSSLTVQSQYMLPKPYITPEEYNASPGHAATLNLVPNGDQAAQDAAVAGIILDASAWVNTICEQVLAATVDTEVDDQLRFHGGYWSITTLQWPILELLSLSIGWSPSNMQPVDVDDATILRSAFKVTSMGMVGASFSGGTLAQIQFGAPGMREGFAIGQYSYVNGYPVTTITAAATAGTSVLAVEDATGIGAPAVGQKLVLRDTYEVVTVLSVDGLEVTLAGPLLYDHVEGAGIDGLPPQVKRATILLTTALIRNPGVQAIVAGNLNAAPRQQAHDEPGHDDARMAIAMLRPFRAVN